MTALIIHYPLSIIHYLFTPYIVIVPGFTQPVTLMHPADCSPAQVVGGHTIVLTSFQLAAPLQLLVLGVTFSVPAAVPAVTVMLLVTPPPVFVQPAGSTQL